MVSEIFVAAFVLKQNVILYTLFIGRSDYNRQNSEHFSKLFSRTDEVRKSSVQWQNKHISFNQGADNKSDTDSK